MVGRFITLQLTLLASLAPVVRAAPRDDVQAAIVKLQAQDPGFSWNTIVKDWIGGKMLSRDNVAGRCRKDGFGEVEVRFRDKRVYLLTYFNRQGDFVANLTGEWRPLKDLAADAKAGDGSEVAAVMTAPELALSLDEVRATVNSASAVRIDGQDRSVLIADLTKDQVAKLLEKRVPATWEQNAPPPLVKSVDAEAGIVRLTIEDGTLTKMEIHVAGTVRFDPNKTVRLRRTCETEFDQIEAFKLQIPERAMTVLAP